MTLPQLPLTHYLALPMARMLARQYWLHRNRKSFATIQGLVSVAAGCGLAIFVGNTIALVAAAALWALGYIMDCVDGILARNLGKSSAAGAGVDAVADVASMGLISATVCLTWIRADQFAVSSSLFALVALILGVGFRATGPLWTVAAAFAASTIVRERQSTDSSASRLRQWYKSVERVSKAVGDPALVTIALGVAVVSTSPATWTSVAIYVLAVGGSTFLLALFNLLYLDNFE